MVATTVVDGSDGFGLVRAEELERRAGCKRWRGTRRTEQATYELAVASGTCLGVLHGMTAVAVATVDLAKLSGLSGELEKKIGGRLKEKEADNLIVLFRKPKGKI